LLEPPAFDWSPWLAAVVLAGPPLAIWLCSAVLVTPLACVLRRFEPTVDPIADARRLGPLAVLGIHGVIARDERPRRRAAAAPSPAVITRPSTGLPSLVLIQAESFFDARRLHPDISADLLPGFDACRRGAEQSGLLEVPCWGANTTRTEFAVLTGLAGDVLGFDRFNPYHVFAKAPVASLAWRLKARGYRTICVHPFDRRFYRRDRIMPELGFDAFLGEEAFVGARRSGPYIADAAVAEFCLDVLREHRGTDVFLFAITMGNHGPWDNTAAAGADLPASLAELPDGAALRQFLAGLRDTDAMIDAFRRGFAGLPALLALYGDHLPSFPAAFSALGFTEPRTDYLIWHRGGGPRVRCDLAAHQFGDVLLEILDGQLRAGLINQTPARIDAAMTPGTTASQVPAAASAPVPAQIVDDSASAIVATRDEVCRRRK
jgi:hypothetical protein